MRQITGKSRRFLLVEALIVIFLLIGVLGSIGRFSIKKLGESRFNSDIKILKNLVLDIKDHIDLYSIGFFITIKKDRGHLVISGRSSIRYQNQDFVFHLQSIKYLRIDGKEIDCISLYCSPNSIIDQSIVEFSNGSLSENINLLFKYFNEKS